MPGGGSIMRGPPLSLLSLVLFSAKSTRILEDPSRSPLSLIARSTAAVSTYSTWQNIVPPRLLWSRRTSLISPHLLKRSTIISSVASLGRPPIQTVLQPSGLTDSGGPPRWLLLLSLPTRYAAMGLSSAKSRRMGTPLTAVPASSTALSTASVSMNFMCPNCPLRNWFTRKDIISILPQLSKRSIKSCSVASMETSPTHRVWPFAGLMLFGRYRRLLGASAWPFGLSATLSMYA